MSNPLTTIVLHFEGNSDTSYECKYEADEVLNIDEEGEEKTSFAPKDPYYFLTYCTGNVEITRVVPTAGSVTHRGSVLRERSDIVDFPELNLETESRPTLSYTPTGGLSQDWFTAIVPTFNVGTGLNLDPNDKTLYITGGVVPCTVELSYDVQFGSWLFTPPAMELPVGESVAIKIFIYLRETFT